MSGAGRQRGRISCDRARARCRPADPDAFHRPYLDLNRQILEALEARDDSAEPMLQAYLERAEDQILTAYRTRFPRGAGPGNDDRAG